MKLLQNADLTKKKWNIINLIFLKAYIKMEKIIKFGDIEIQKAKNFHHHKETISIKNIDINKIVVSNKVSFVKKNLNTLLAAKVLKKRPLCIFLPKMRVYRKAFDETKSMSFLIKDDELLEKYNEIWKKLKNIIKKNLIVNQYIMKNI